MSARSPKRDADEQQRLRGHERQRNRAPADDDNSQAKCNTCGCDEWAHAAPCAIHDASPIMHVATPAPSSAGTRRIRIFARELSITATSAHNAATAAANPSMFQGAD